MKFLIILTEIITNHKYFFSKCVAGRFVKILFKPIDIWKRHMVYSNFQA